jgi:hypothetical protein
MASELNTREFIVNTITWDHAARLRSYELLAREFGLQFSEPHDASVVTELMQNR